MGLPLDEYKVWCARSNVEHQRRVFYSDLAQEGEAVASDEQMQSVRMPIHLSPMGQPHRVHMSVWLT